MNQVLPAVKAIILRGNKFLIIKQVVGDKDILWDLPGGKVNFGESPYDTLYREVKEETYLDIEIIRPVGFWWFFRKTDGSQVICATFICTSRLNNVDLTKNPADENISEFRWVTKDEFLGGNYTVGHDSLTELISKVL